MKTIVVSKSTNLQRHGEGFHKNIEKGIVDGHYLTDLKREHQQHCQTENKVLEILTREFSVIEQVDLEGLDQVDFKGFDLVITIGGDGTLLATSHRLDDKTPVLGVRSSDASVGYLCASHQSTFEDILLEFLNQKLKTVSLQRIKAQITKASSCEVITTSSALNDVLFANSNPSCTTRYEIRYQKQREMHRSSGVWVSTATGSTAAIRAAGSTPIDILSKDTLFRVREPYYLPQNQLNIVSDRFSLKNQTLQIQNFCEEAILAIDGRHHQHTLHFGDHIDFLQAVPLSLVWQ